MSLDHDDDAGTNLSNNPGIADILDLHLTRRQALAGGMSATTTALFGGAGALGLAACASETDTGTAALASALLTSKLGFAAVAKSTADVLTVPAGYTASALWALGDAFTTGDTAWADNGSETAESYNRRAGDHHDGLYYFGLNTAGTAADYAGTLGGNTRGILAMNHEAPNPFNTGTGANNLYVHASGATTTVASGTATRTDAAQVRKEVNHHGVSIIDIAKTGSTWAVRKDSTFNRRVTGATVMEITGPMRGNARMFTKFSPN